MASKLSLREQTRLRYLAAFDTVMPARIAERAAEFVADLVGRAQAGPTALGDEIVAAMAGMVEVAEILGLPELRKALGLAMRTMLEEVQAQGRIVIRPPDAGGGAAGDDAISHGPGGP